MNSIPDPKDVIYLIDDDVEIDESSDELVGLVRRLCLSARLLQGPSAYRDNLAHEIGMSL